MLRPHCRQRPVITANLPVVKLLGLFARILIKTFSKFYSPCTKVRQMNSPTPIDKKGIASEVLFAIKFIIIVATKEHDSMIRNILLIIRFYYD